MKTSDTPRTDAAYFAPASTIDDIAREMRKLELELAAANERIRRLERSLDLCDPRFSRFCRTVLQAESAPEGGGQAMSDTPRTDLNHLTVETLRTMKGTGTQIVLAAFARDLERELAAANERIRRLEEAGDAMLNAWLMPEDSMEYSDWVCLSSDAKSKWYAAKEAKP